LAHACASSAAISSLASREPALSGVESNDVDRRRILAL
jgi:hypothetical protein